MKDSLCVPIITLFLSASFSCQREHSLFSYEVLEDSIMSYMNTTDDTICFIMEDFRAGSSVFCVQSTISYDRNLCDWHTTYNGIHLVYYAASRCFSPSIDTTLWTAFNDSIEDLPVWGTVMRNDGPNPKIWTLRNDHETFTLKKGWSAPSCINYSTFVKDSQFAALMDYYHKQWNQKCFYVRFYQKDEKCYAIMGRSLQYSTEYPSYYYEENGYCLVVYPMNADNLSHIINFESMHLLTDSSSMPCCKLTPSIWFFLYDRAYVKISPNLGITDITGTDEAQDLRYEEMRALTELDTQ